MKLNLAKQPFHNRRPRRRITTLLWSVAVAVLALNAILFAQYWQGSSNGREELRAMREQARSQIATIEEMRGELSSEGLKAQNEHVRFLNRKISERTFPWSLLFDDMAEVLPRNVRIDGMAPSIPIKKKRGKTAVEATTIDWIQLDLRGTAKGSEDLLELVDAMFDDPSFTGPVLRSERDIEGGEVEFDFSVRYRVAKPTQEADLSMEAIQLTAGGGFVAGVAVEGETTLAHNDGETTQSVSSSGAGVGSPEAGRRAAMGSQRDRLERGDGGQSTVVEGAERINVAARPERGANGRKTSKGGSASLGSTSSASAAGLQAKGFRPQGQLAPATGRQGAVEGADPNTSRERQTKEQQARSASQEGRRSPERTTEEIADERFGKDDPVAPRLPNASGSGNGGAR